jgi:hypothetical protein
MKRIARPLWFARLRRDQRLFALLALLLVLAHSLQPLAVAQASASGDLVICTMLGAEPLPNGTPVQHDGCGECVISACGLQPAVKAVAGSAPAWQPLASVAFDPRPAADQSPPALWPPERPPGSRAPPFDA